MPKIKIIEGTTLGSKVIHPGEIHEVDDPTAALLISQKQVSLYVEPPKPVEPPALEEVELTLELLEQLKKEDKLDEVTVKELQEFAAQNGIELKRGLSKLEIVEELLKHLND